MKPASLAIETVIFHRQSGAAVMALLDARDAVRRFPTDWSHAPWGGDEPPSDAAIYIPSDWADLSEQERRGLALRIDRSCASKSQAACDALVAQRFADRFDAAAELSVPR